MTKLMSALVSAIIFSALNAHANDSIYTREYQSYDYNRSYECDGNNLLAIGQTYGIKEIEDTGNQIKILFTINNQAAIEFHTEYQLGYNVSVMFMDIVTDNDRILWLKPPVDANLSEGQELYVKLYKDRFENNLVLFTKNYEVDQVIAYSCRVHGVLK